MGNDNKKPGRAVTKKSGMTKKPVLTSPAMPAVVRENNAFLVRYKRFRNAAQAIEARRRAARRRLAKQAAEAAAAAEIATEELLEA